MKQSDLFAESEGDAWHERNRDKPRLPDPVLDTIAGLGLKPKTVVEIGCGDGWRLAEIKHLYNPEVCNGYEPSEQAVRERVHTSVVQGSATETMPYIRRDFYDIIIFGFCFYLIDREDLLYIAAMADRMLKIGGHIIIHDFLPDQPCRRAYHHKEGVWSYKMHHARLWLGSPQYKQVLIESTSGEGEDRIGVSVLQKLSMDEAWPERTER